MIHTPLCDLLGTEFPIIQGAMAHVSTGAFAAAVSGAGGLGVIASSSKDEAYTREQIKAVRARTRYPFGVNITLSNPSEAIVDVILEEGVSIVFTGAGNPAPYMKDLLSNGCKVIPVVPHVRAAKKMGECCINTDYPNIRTNSSIVLLTWKRAKRLMVKSTTFNYLDTMQVFR
ncbi:MAG: nitronate monooxygenase, partial [Synergistaceae bacterium]|nr:nitronate monooxygenase [Synergistaceae bacterium]